MDSFYNPLYYPYRAYYSQNKMCSYGYPPIYFEHVDSINKNNIQPTNQNYSQEQNTRTNLNQDSNQPQKGFNFNDIISLDEDRISVLGFSINIDDLIILITLYTMFKNGSEIDYLLVIILGILLFSQD